MPYLPAYSPDLLGAPPPKPIEQAWAKLRARLRARAARTIDALDEELGPAIATITRQDARGWFCCCCGYPTPD